MIAFGFMLAFAGIIVLIAGAAQAMQNRSYAACTQTVTGTVTRKRSRTVKNGKAYELTVAYTVDGTAYEKIVGVLLTEYNATQEDDEIELRYQANNPKKAVRPTVLQPRNVRVLLIVGAVLLVAGIALLLFGRM